MWGKPPRLPFRANRPSPEIEPFSAPLLSSHGRAVSVSKKVSALGAYCSMPPCSALCWFSAQPPDSETPSGRERGRLWQVM